MISFINTPAISTPRESDYCFAGRDHDVEVDGYQNYLEAEPAVPLCWQQILRYTTTTSSTICCSPALGQVAPRVIAVPTVPAGISEAQEIIEQRSQAWGLNFK